MDVTGYGGVGGQIQGVVVCQTLLMGPPGWVIRS